MANFKPWKDYTLELLDELIATRNLQPPFLDVGCGSGDVALHLARRGWAGLALDPSPPAAAAAVELLAPLANLVAVHHGDVSTAMGTFRTALIFDVLEHMPDDAAVLQAVAERLETGGAVVVTVPTRREEWRWDDDFYGHVRRYEAEELARLFTRVGLTIRTSWDCTFPFFWLMRRAYTYLLPPKPAAASDDLTRTLQSTCHSAWDRSPTMSRFAQSPWLWRPLLAIQRRFRGRPWGCERLILGTKD